MWRNLGTRVVPVVALIVFVPCLANAQEDGRQFIMLLRTNNDTSAKDVELLLQASLNAISDQGVKGSFLAPRPALPEVYYQMLEWMEDVSTEAPIQGGAIQIRRFARQSTDWNLNLGIPDNSLLDLTVFLEDPGNAQLREEKFNVTVGPDAKLRYHSQGRYIVTLPLNTRPVKYSARIRDGRTGEIKEVKGEWPVPDSFFFVRFTNFVGDERILYEALREGAAGQKVKQIHEAKAFEIVLADFLPQASPTGLFWQQNRLTAREPMPEGLANVRRVWMQFPMTAELAKRRWIELSKLERDAVSEQIRNEANVPYNGPDPVSISPSYTEPKWYELAPVRDSDGAVRHFERSFLLEDVGKWKEITEGIDSAWRLVVFEFDDGSLQYALSVTHPVRSVNTFVVDQEMADWVIGVTERLTEGDAAPK